MHYIFVGYYDSAEENSSVKGIWIEVIKPEKLGKAILNACPNRVYAKLLVHAGQVNFDESQCLLNFSYINENQRKDNTIIVFPNLGQATSRGEMQFLFDVSKNIWYAFGNLMSANYVGLDDDLTHVPMGEEISLENYVAVETVLREYETSYTCGQLDDLHQSKFRHKLYKQSYKNRYDEDRFWAFYWAVRYGVTNETTYTWDQFLAENIYNVDSEPEKPAPSILVSIYETIEERISGCLQAYRNDDHNIAQMLKNQAIKLYIKASLAEDVDREKLQSMGDQLNIICSVVL